MSYAIIPRRNPELMTWSEFAVSKFATEFVTAMLVAALTSILFDRLKRNIDEKGRCNLVLMQEVKQAIQDVQNLAEDLFVEAEKNLTGNWDVSAKETQRKIGLLLGRITGKYETLKLYVSQHAGQSFENAVYRMHNELLADPYPIQRKADAIKHNDAHLRNINTKVRVEWVKFLSQFSMDCQTGKVKIGLKT